MLILGLGIAVLILVLDQLSKFFIASIVLADANIITLTPFFNIVRAWNTGVSFSMFNSGGQTGVILLSTIALAIVGVLLWWLWSEKNRLVQVSIGFIIGGALGNVIDRVRFGAVFDFLDVHAFGRHWPAFNVADTFICIGAGLIILHSLLNEKEGKKK